MTELTVVMPAYNEADNIREAVAEVVSGVFSAVPHAELLVVNDGSKDKTGAILEQIAATEPRLRVLTQPNGGHGAALRNGMEAAKGDHLLLLDSDRQISLEHFGGHWNRLGSADAVLGMRATRHDPRHRLVISWCMRQFLKLLFGKVPRDANIPYKLVPRSAWAAARETIPEGCLIPSALFGVWLAGSGLKLAQVEIEHRERTAGETVLKAWKLAKFCWRAAGDVMRFRGALSRQRRRLKQEKKADA